MRPSAVTRARAPFTFSTTAVAAKVASVVVPTDEAMLLLPHPKDRRRHAHPGRPGGRGRLSLYILVKSKPLHRRMMLLGL
jgi:hypothetical protein